ncbi:putative nuclear matrix constituent protein 1-like protein [Acorus gramineus]|uniref:Nuclear matrix constituent protein 1-like protein n=1 Tax=Acorus gramineus TaxID=55184 RepID=A0AAV9BTT8_ACOGR|nr:putative nuclear matrix constituent protein 1-like protein [Acorus gramineus]
MLTPRRKGWFATPKSAGGAGGPVTPSTRNGMGGGLLSKGKGVVGADLPPPPPLDSLEANGGEGDGGSVGEAEVWRRFRQAGMLDPASMERKDKAALVERVDSLERELYDYQYNMGLLLIEKKDMESKFEEYRQYLAEAEELLKREKSAHIMAFSELEKREENLKKALEIEKQCVADLEKALHELRTESAEVRVTSDRKLDEAQDLVARNEQKSLEVDAKRRAADAKLAEANRKSSEIEMRIKELEARERMLQTERMSLKAERESDEAENSRRTEYLRDWEKRLQLNQERLLEGERLLNKREERLNESDIVFKQKEKEFEEARKKFEESNIVLKEKEADIAERLSSLETEEKEVDLAKEKLIAKEQELLVLEEKLDAREQVEMQKLINEHSAALEVKKREFDVELQKRRKSLDDELKDKNAALEGKEDELNRKDERVAKREHALDVKEEKLKGEEKNIESKSKELKKLDDSLKLREKDLEKEINQLAIEKQQMSVSFKDLEKVKIEIENEKESILREREHLQITEAERNSFDCLRLQLKDEIEENRRLKQSLLRDAEDLKKERENFEKEWEALDEKRTAVAEDLKQLDEEKERLQRWHHDEEQKFRREKAEALEKVEQDLESIRLEKEDFLLNIEVERKKEAELGERKRADMEREYAQMKHELEMNMQIRENEMLKRIQEKERAFEEVKEKEWKEVNYLRGTAAEEMQNLKTEQEKNERDRRDLALQQKRIEEDQADIKLDIERLLKLSASLKEQREEFNKERQRFLSQVEQHKICRNCGVIIINEAELFGLLPQENEDFRFDVSRVEERMKGKLASSQMPSNNMSPQLMGSSPPASASRMSWLRKCKQIFNFSPVKIVEDNAEDRLDTRAASIDDAEDASQPSFGAVSDSIGIPRVQSTEMGVEPQSSLQADTEATDHVHENDDEPEPSNNVETGVAELAEDTPRPRSTKTTRRKKGKAKAIKRTRSVAAVVEDAKAILGETTEKNDKQTNQKSPEVSELHAESRGDSQRVGQKRQRSHVSGATASEQEAEDSEARSDSIVAGGRRKRQQTLPPARERPYNFRRSTVAAAHKGATAEAHPSKVRGDNAEGTSNPEQNSQLSLGAAGGDDGVVRLSRKSVVARVIEVHESSSQKLVQIGRGGLSQETDGRAENEFSENRVNGVGDDIEEAEAMAINDVEEGYETEEGGSDDYAEDEDTGKGNASISKKLWKFFTT